MSLIISVSAGFTVCEQRSCEIHDLKLENLQNAKSFWKMFDKTEATVDPMTATVDPMTTTEDLMKTTEDPMTEKQQFRGLI